MSMEAEFGTILDVLPDGTCNVAGEKGATFDAVQVYATGYTPAQHDDVYVVFKGDTPVIIGAFGSRRPVVPTITVQDTTPTGGDLRQVTSLWQHTDAGDSIPTLIGVRSSPPPAPVTVTDGPVTPSLSGTYDEVNGWQFGDVLQGQVDGFAHTRTGEWIYPDLTDSRTATGLSIRVHRKVGGGTGGNVALRFYLHGDTAAPAGVPALYESFDADGALTLSPDAVATFTLPAPWGGLLAAGTRKGVAISSASFADYGRFDDGTLTRTFAS